MALRPEDKQAASIAQISLHWSQTGISFHVDRWTDGQRRQRKHFFAPRAMERILPGSI